MSEPTRCEWAGTEPPMVAYHDDDWGVPTHDDDAARFEPLTLEGGLPRRVRRFEVEPVTRFGAADVERLRGDASIVRHRGKIESTITTARAIEAAEDEFGSFDAYVWQFVEGSPIVNEWSGLGQFSATTAESTESSKDLERRGFRFVGPTTVSAFMQAGGLVDDHVVSCFRHADHRHTGQGR